MLALTPIWGPGTWGSIFPWPLPWAPQTALFHCILPGSWKTLTSCGGQEVLGEWEMLWVNNAEQAALIGFREADTLST